MTPSKDVPAADPSGLHSSETHAAPSLPAVSSIEIRARIARGEDVSGLVPRKVREYAEAKRLYR